MMYDAFLSYNTKDRAAVEAIALYLKEKAGMKLFFDRWEKRRGQVKYLLFRFPLLHSGNRSDSLNPLI
jgi:hypothetical protein